MARVVRRTRQVRHDSPTIPVPGSSGVGFGQDDDGKYFSCWHCGWTCDKDRESLGDSQTPNNVSTESYQDEARPQTGDPLSAVAVSGGVPASQVLMELGADGVTDREIFNGVKSEPEQGCPLCGTLNWRGDF